MKILVSEFKDYWTTVPLRTVDLFEWLTSPNTYMWLIRKIRAEPNKDRRDRLKSSLPGVTVSAIFRERNMTGFLSHSGCISLDFDYLQNIPASKQLISTHESVLYCGESVSGQGLFAIVRIREPQKHLEHFFALERDFLNMGLVVDPSCKDIPRLRGLSYDSSPYINMNAEIYTKTLMYETPAVQRIARISQQVFNPEQQPIQRYMKPRDTPAEALLKSSLRHGIQVLANDTETRIKSLISLIQERQVDITFHWFDWFRICNIIVRVFGAGGRELFHDISRFYHKNEEKRYSPAECDKLYSACLNKTYRYSVNEIFWIARRYGIY